MTKKKIPIGVDDFLKLIEKDYQFVDKTLFIKEILDDGAESLLITRPRRWGKTLNLSMLHYFLSNRLSTEVVQKAFAHLKIMSIDDGKYAHEQGQYPVILITLKDIKEQSFNGAIEAIKILIQRLYSDHDCLLDSDLLSEVTKEQFAYYLKGKVNQQQLESSLLFLSRCLKQHYGKKSYILIDEYDTPLNCSYEYAYLNSMTEFMQNFLSAALKGNHYLEKGVMTGILRISKDSMLSGLNNLKVYSLLKSNYAAHFGFTDSEVDALFRERALNYNLDKIRHYYNGYRIGELKLYNPWSIMECLDEQGELAPYWVNTASDKLLKRFLISAPLETQQELRQLIGGDRHTITTLISDSVRFEDLDNGGEAYLWSLLLAMGYLTTLTQKRINLLYRCELGVPNQEIREVYIGIFQQWMIGQLGMRSYNDLLESLISGDIEGFTQRLESYLLTYASHYDFPSESNYHTFMLGLLCGMTPNYYLFSNAEAGKGRADMMLIPRDKKAQFAVIMEFKYHKEEATQELALAGLTQIQMRGYQSAISRYPDIKKVLKIGLAFSGSKHVKSVYRWDDQSI